MKDAIIAALPGDFPWQNQILWFDTIDSTNTRAKELARQGAPHGTVLLADSQTGGRGRLGRSFHSPAGTGIYMSVILRPDCGPGDLMHLTCAVAVAMCDAVEAATGLRPGIKWTNDLVSGQRKLGGILTELGLRQDGKTDYSIIGIGLNCCQSEADFPEEIRAIAGSLSGVTGRDIDRARVVAAMLTSLRDMNDSLLAGREQMISRYRRDCITVGQDISLLRGEEVRHGKAVDVDEEGALVVLFPDGHLEAVNSGEVSVRGMYGYI